MTDAALPVTEEAVERFTEDYLRSLGAEIEKDGRQWNVSLPADADTDLAVDGAVLEITTDPETVEEGAIPVAPESDFVERMLDEASTLATTGTLALTAGNTEVILPEWIAESSLQPVTTEFTPYYDRRAVCILFEVGIETVSEYQTEELHAVTIDTNSHTCRPRLTETVLELTESGSSFETCSWNLDTQTMEATIKTARGAVREEIQSTVEEIQRQATRAAEVELDEYRELIQQRREEIESNIRDLLDQIDDATETIDNASSRDNRVEALRRRKELQSDREELQKELDDIVEEIESGFEQKKRGIWDRHRITVTLSPTTATGVSYERGELTVEFATDQESAIRTYSYAVGIGVIDDTECERCGEALSGSNPATLSQDTIVGANCCGPK